MAFQAVPDTAQVTMVFDGVTGGPLDGAHAEPSLYVRDTVVGWPVAQLALLADFTADWFTAGKNAGTPFSLDFQPQWVLSKTVARSLTVASGPVAEQTVNAAGTRGGLALAPNCALLIRMPTDAGAVPPKGYTFWNVGEEGDIDGQNFSVAFVAVVVQHLLDWRADLADPLAGGFVSWAHCAVSRSLGTQPPVKVRKVATRRAQGITALVQSVNGRRLVASQRDRRAGE